MSHPKVTRPVKLHLALDEALHAWLVALAIEESCSVAELFRRGFAVLKICDRMKRERPDLHFGMTSDPAKLEIEIVGVLNGPIT